MLELTIDQSINAINVVISVKQKFQKPYLWLIFINFLMGM